MLASKTYLSQLEKESKFTELSSLNNLSELNNLNNFGKFHGFQEEDMSNNCNQNKHNNNVHETFDAISIFKQYVMNSATGALERGQIVGHEASAHNYKRKHIYQDGNDVDERVHHDILRPGARDSCSKFQSFEPRTFKTQKLSLSEDVFVNKQRNKRNESCTKFYQGQVTMKDEHYGTYQPPYRIVVSGLTFSHPENFVKKSSIQIIPTNPDDSDGAWMNAGIGGESNSIDVAVELKDANGRLVQECNSIPLKVRLWGCVEEAIADQPIDEISQNNEETKGGHRKSRHFMFCGKPNSRLVLGSDGKATISLRVTTTSQLNDRRRFCFEVLPDVNREEFQNEFVSFNFAKAGDSHFLNSALSPTVEVMSKKNKIPKHKEVQSSISQAEVSLNRSMDYLSAALSSSSEAAIDDRAVQHMLKRCEEMYHKLLNIPLPSLNSQTVAQVVQRQLQSQVQQQNVQLDPRVAAMANADPNQSSGMTGLSDLLNINSTVGNEDFDAVARQVFERFSSSGGAPDMDDFNPDVDENDNES